MKRLLISDLHLDARRPEIAKALFTFLKGQCQNIDELYILGDFFEAWVGDDYNSPFIQSIKDALQHLSHKIPIYFMHGNRDFLVGERFLRETGCQAIPDERHLLAWNNKSILLMHGDSLCTDDVDYMAFRQQVRNPDWQRDFLKKPLSERLAIANQLREQSMLASTQKAAEITDVSPTAVAATFGSYNCELLIHGHTHRPAIHSLDFDATKKRIVLGDWGHYGWYLELTATEYRLEKFLI